jgi:hypothetical protein
MRGWCFKIEVVRNSFNLYCGRVQCLSTDVVRLSLDRCYGLFMVLVLVGMVHGQVYSFRATAVYCIYWGLLQFRFFDRLLQLLCFPFLHSVDGLVTGPVLFFTGDLPWWPAVRMDPVLLVVSPAWSTISLTMV